MERQEFVKYLSECPEQYGFEEKSLDDKVAGTPTSSWGVLVENRFYQTKTFVSDQAITNNDLTRILVATHQGRNIEHITRVTGYFSKVGGWNKGKVAELVDRHRTPLS